MKLTKGPDPAAAKFMLRGGDEIQLAGGPDLISFGTGIPNATCFPFESFTVKTKDNLNYVISGDLLKTALQYGPTPGHPGLWKFVYDLQMRLHNPPTKTKTGDESLDLLIVPGSQDGLGRIIDMAVNPGDNVLVEEPNYPAVKAQLLALKANWVIVKHDENGMIPSSLVEALSPWKPEDAKNPKSKIPRLIYLQPNHNNPTGISLANDRRREIYKIAQKYDLLIVEDDPYYLLTFKEPLPPSFLSLDTDGRVLRLDSFSKVMAAGMRIGYVTGARPFIERLHYHLQIGSMESPSFSQVVAFELLNRWGMDKFYEHSRKVAAFYKSQCEMMLTTANTHLKGLAEWNEPKGGMFIWMKVLGINDTDKLITEKALSSKIVFATGSMFMFDSNKPTPFLRSSFSNVDGERMEKDENKMDDTRL